ncbi:class I SAM-dependent methyltransferase [Variovorax sp. M-6]|uniref:class I SAM-dependent methyltransferase n=1 Tax=Variovorax sp. M-6 TaxID=3233041 RepID=UPI003F998183
MLDADRVAREVNAFYERHPYPPPVDDLERYRQSWNEDRRRAEAHLFWPDEPYREDRTILVAGCGTSQAAKHAMRWPRAKVVGIDVSATGIEQTERLRRKHGLDNLELRQLPVERASELGRTFDHVVCTGVLHHLPHPDTGLQALRDVLAPNGAMHLMVYAPYGRAGVYLLQDYCRRLGIGTTADEIEALAASLRALPPDHPLMPLLRSAPDFKDQAGLADALLHPQDRAYSVPQLFEFLRAGGLRFGRWLGQAAYLPQCGALASSAHLPLLSRLPVEEQYAAVELFRGSMVRHSVVAYRIERPDHERVDFKGDAWLDFVPLRAPDTVVVQERLQPGAAAVLINRHHTYTDLYLPITAQQKKLVDAIDGKRSIGEIAPEHALRQVARVLFEGLWWYDQVVFDLSRTRVEGRM